MGSTIFVPTDAMTLPKTSERLRSDVVATCTLKVRSRSVPFSLFDLGSAAERTISTASAGIDAVESDRTMASRTPWDLRRTSLAAASICASVVLFCTVGAFRVPATAVAADCSLRRVVSLSRRHLSFNAVSATTRVFCGCVDRVSVRRCDRGCAVQSREQGSTGHPLHAVHDFENPGSTPSARTCRITRGIQNHEPPSRPPK